MGQGAQCRFSFVCIVRVKDGTKDKKGVAGKAAFNSEGRTISAIIEFAASRIYKVYRVRALQRPQRCVTGQLRPLLR